MCLTVLPGCKPEIAKEDILCYKAVVDHVKYWSPAIHPFKAGYSYPYNKVLTAESHVIGKIHPIQHLEMKGGGCLNFYIEEGFHANRNKTYLRTNPCIIPKGTEYCLGEDDEIVAVNMIVFRSMLDYYWYRIKKLWQE